MTIRYIKATAHSADRREALVHGIHAFRGLSAAAMNIFHQARTSDPLSPRANDASASPACSPARVLRRKSQIQAIRGRRLTYREHVDTAKISSLFHPSWPPRACGVFHSP